MKPNGEPTRLLLSLQAWGASSKPDAKSKAKTISQRNKKGKESWPQKNILDLKQFKQALQKKVDTV